MRRVSRIVAAGVVTAALALTSAACGSDDSDSGSDSGGDQGIGLAYDVGGRSDASFNESAARGFDKAKKEFDLKGKELTAREGDTEADREQRLTSLAEAGYNPVIGVGFAYGKSVNKVAKEFPDTTFGVVDSASEGKNVAGLNFAEHEGSYLAGVAAAEKSKTGKVGFIGGVHNNLIKKFEAGYVQGAMATDPDIEVVVEYLYESDLKGFQDPIRAKGQAEGMLDDDTDVIYTAAGLSGSGSIEAVSEKKGAWAIGVDSDQYRNKSLAKYKDSILTSVVKNVDVAVYDLIASVQDGKPVTGNKSFTLKDDGVSLAKSGGFIDDIQPAIDAARKKIADGDVKVKDVP